MFTLHLVRLSVLLGAFTPLVAAVPVPGLSLNPTSGPVLCSSILKFLCRKDEGEVRVLTPVGIARGFLASTTSSRYVIHFSSFLRRLTRPQVCSQVCYCDSLGVAIYGHIMEHCVCFYIFHFDARVDDPDNQFNSGSSVSQLPPMCPQNEVDASAYSEDCLYLTAYTPRPTPTSLSNVPVLVW